ncbi:hypothetical protein, partial [Bosea sp. (in: a-proteobacteria)]|uniref:hypothetical protein n=1 Tax=Bosea sp. (in: a-proteobacteria) TaxID=1871050 RepID=UPI0031FE91ED
MSTTDTLAVLTRYATKLSQEQIEFLADNQGDGSGSAEDKTRAFVFTDLTFLRCGPVIALETAVWKAFLLRRFKMCLGHVDKKHPPFHNFLQHFSSKKGKGKNTKSVLQKHIDFFKYITSLPELMQNYLRGLMEQGGELQEELDMKKGKLETKLANMAKLAEEYASLAKYINRSTNPAWTQQVYHDTMKTKLAEVPGIDTSCIPYPSGEYDNTGAGGRFGSDFDEWKDHQLVVYMRNIINHPEDDWNVW